MDKIYTVALGDQEAKITVYGLAKESDTSCSLLSNTYTGSRPRPKKTCAKSMEEAQVLLNKMVDEKIVALNSQIAQFEKIRTATPVIVDQCPTE